MHLKNSFSRNNISCNKKSSDSTTHHSQNAITCDTLELKKLITEWTQNEYWEFENFADFIELIGIKTPVKLSDLDEENHSFKCITALNTEIRIFLFFGDFFEFSSAIRIIDGEETRHYLTNTNNEKGKSVPNVALQGRNIKTTGKELSSYYSEFLCHRTLKLDDTHVLKIEIDEPDKYEEKSEIFVLRNCKDIEEYLLGLDSSLVVDTVYEKVMELLNFSNEDISKCEKILISHIETVDKEERVREKIFLTKGKMQEYAILENGETFHVLKDGSWKYLSDSGIRIVYLQEMKHHVFSITGAEENITTANPSEIMNRVKAKISKMWEFVK